MRPREVAQEENMNTLELIKGITLVIHFVGLAILVGLFVANMKTKTNFPFGLMIPAAAIQLVTGVILVGMKYALDEDVNNAKIGIKFVLALAALVAAVIGNIRQKKGETKLQPFFHAAGGFAIVDIVIAVLWSTDIWGA
jgi:hypothetical protein